MLKEAVYHINDIPYLFAIGADTVKIRIRAGRGEVKHCQLLHCDRYESPGSERASLMQLVASTELHDYYEAIIRTDTGRIRYQFLLTGCDGDQVWCGEQGAAGGRREAGYFHCPYVAALDDGSPPAWVKEAIVYQIFPERFHNGDARLNPPGTLSWSDTDALCAGSFYGGNLPGVIEKLPYLYDLGITLIYMTPIFESHSNHKYDTIDYYKIDPRFGTLEQFKELVEQAHRLGIRIMLDAVFNHTGDGFFAFQDVMRRGEQSVYKDWFFIESYPVVQQPIANYESFGNDAVSMPKLNTRHDEAADYMIDVAKYWIRETGIDGWRLDVANEVDHAFWRRFRSEIKAMGKELLIVGEVMHLAGAWLRGDQFDGVMNYPLRDALLDFFAKQTITVRSFVGRIAAIRMQHTDYANAAMFNLLGSHDTERFLTMCSRSEWGWDKKREIERLKLAVLFQMTYTGMPMIYYGDEVGMTGEHDPYCRKPMEWDDARQDAGLLEHYKTLIALRKSHTALQHGDFRLWFEEEASNTFGYIRSDGTEWIGVVINNSPVAQQVQAVLPERCTTHAIRNLYGDTTLELRVVRVVGHVNPYSGVILSLGPGLG